MACESRRSTRQQTLGERMEEIRTSLARLEYQLLNGGVQLKIGANGAIAFAGWSKEDRRDITDSCAFRMLTSADSWALRQARARAEIMAGRKVDEKVVASGVHSHDGGLTWSKH